MHMVTGKSASMARGMNITVAANGVDGKIKARKDLNDHDHEVRAAVAPVENLQRFLIEK